MVDDGDILMVVGVLAGGCPLTVSGAVGGNGVIVHPPTVSWALQGSEDEVRLFLSDPSVLFGSAVRFIGQDAGCSSENKFCIDSVSDCLVSTLARPVVLSCRVQTTAKEVLADVLVLSLISLDTRVFETRVRRLVG